MKARKSIGNSISPHADSVSGTGGPLQEGEVHKWELSRNLKHLADTPNADRVGNNAAFVCPMCQHVYIVSNGKPLGKAQKKQGRRPCPNCGESIAQMTKGGLSEGGRAWIMWPVEKGTE